MSAQYAAEDLPFAMFLLCLALKLLRLAFVAELSPFFGEPAVLAPCSPKRIIFSLPSKHALTTCDFLGWLGVRLGLLHGIFDLITLTVAMIFSTLARLICGQAMLYLLDFYLLVIQTDKQVHVSILIHLHQVQMD